MGYIYCVTMTIAKYIGLFCGFFFLSFPSSYTQVLRDSLRFIPSAAIEELYLVQVNDLIKQDDGLMWLGTDQGLARFDGTSVNYVEIKNESGSFLKTFSVRKLIKSKAIDQRLYLCTDADGLIEYNMHSGLSRTYRHIPEELTSLKGNNIISLEEEDNGDFWVSTDDFVLSYFDRESAKFTHYKPSLPSGRQESGLLGEMVTCPLNPNHLWMASRFGLYRFNKETKKFTLFPFDEKYDDYFASRYLELWADEQEKVLWIGRFHDGLWRYDPRTGKPLSSGVLFSPETTFNRNLVQSIFAFDQQTILISSERDGFAEFNRQTGALKDVYTSTTGLPVSNFEVKSFLKDEEDYLWLGAKTGLYRFTPQKESSRFILFENWLHDYVVANDSRVEGLDSIEYNLYKRNWLRSDLFSKDGKRLYLGTLNGDGLFIYEVTTDSFHLVRYRSGPAYGAMDVWLDDLCEDDRGRIWIGSDEGLLLYEATKDRIEKKHLNYDLVDDAHITSLASKDSFLYIGTRSNGLFRLNHKDGKIIPFSNKVEDNLLPQQEVNKVLFDHNGNLWIGTNTGLFIYQPEQAKFLSFKDHNGGGVWLSELSAYDIIETPEHDIFITTLGDGLISYHPKEKKWKNYRSSSYEQNFMGELVLGANQNIIISSINQHLEFNPSLAYDEFLEFQDFWAYTGIERSLIAFPDGRVWSGGIKGISEARIHAMSEEVNMQLYIKKVLISGQERYSSSQLNSDQKLRLSYKDNTFSLEPGALNFSLHPKNYFFQKLVGVDQDWIEVQTNNTITYSHVPPGQYRYLYRARDQSGRWTKDTGSFEVIIYPPWWRSPLAYIAYGCLILAGIILARRQIIRQEELKSRLQMEQLEKERIQEIEQLRANFYANISHEFRTPLTLIKAPLEDLLISRKDDADRLAFFQMHQNTERLLALVHQLLDLSRLESRVLSLETTRIDIYSLLKQLMGNFQSLADHKQLELEIEVPREKLYLEIDQDKFEKIILNLLSNAVKFAPKNGWVQLAAYYDEGLKVRVGNNGEAIPLGEQEKIFERFYQARNIRHQGAGIGLALVRELVELHQGQINVDSSTANSTWFCLELPLEKAIGSKDETQMINPTILTPTTTIATPIAKEPSIVPNDERPLVLVVEDHEEVRNYIKEKLESNYNIIEASNGEAGLIQATKRLPDLILSDLMMPKMDGLTFCQKIKADHRTDHIPFILLTAKADLDSRLQGLSIGADDYLAKPFNNRELQLRIKNLIEQRQKNRERFAQTMTLEPQAILLNSLEKNFVEKAIRIVEEHMDNPSYNTTDFCKALLLSRTHLHRKLKQLTGYSATDFIRHLRLQRAAQLLEAEADSVTQIAYQVGFKSQSYFTKCFKAKYGMAPSVFKKTKLDKLENKSSESI